MSSALDSIKNVLKLLPSSSTSLGSIYQYVFSAVASTPPGSILMYPLDSPSLLRI